MANPRKFSEKIALHNQKQAEETAAFEKIMREVSDATNRVHSGAHHCQPRPPPEPAVTNTSLRPVQPSLGTFRSGSLPNVAAPQAPILNTETEEVPHPEEVSLAAQYGMGPRVGGTSPSRSPGQRGRASSSVGPIRSRPADRKHDTSPYGSTAYLSPPPDSSWRRTNSDSALHQSCGGAGAGMEQQQVATALSPHHLMHSHGHPHQNHRRAVDIHLETLSTLGVNTNRPRSSCEIPRIPNNNPYESGGGGGAGGLMCGELQMPGGSLPDLTSVHFPPPPHTYPVHPHRTSPDYLHQSPTSPGALSPSAGASPATGGLSPASGSPVGATVPSLAGPLDHALHAALRSENTLYDTQNHLSVPNTNNYLHHNKSMSPLDHNWITSSYQSHCSPPSQYSSTSNINIPSPTMVHSPGSPADSPQTDYTNMHQSLLQPFQQITMLDPPNSNYNTTYINHSSPHSPQTTNSPHTYSQAVHRSPSSNGTGSMSRECRSAVRGDRDPVPGGNGPVFPSLNSPSTPAIPDIILTDYSGELDAGIFGEEAQLRAGLDLDDLTLLEEPSSLLPDSSVEQEFRLDRM